MSVIIFAEAVEGKLKKSAFEAVTYGRKVADLVGSTCKAITLGTVENSGELGIYGAQEVYNVNDSVLNSFDSQVYASAIADAFAQLGGTILILSHSAIGKSLTGRLSVKLGAGSVSGASGLPDVTVGFVVPKSVYSGKATAFYDISSDKKIVSVMGNAIKFEKTGNVVDVKDLAVTVVQPKVTVIERKTVSGVVPLPEASLVVSAGRGMKDPSNWGIIEDLATQLGATTACSRPVSDSGWRPHHEHVGQTGIAIRPNLYIAIGISGAIQHLAGVNNSRVIVVINKDPEAPFFKAADYGIVGDLFEVVPKLIESVKKFKSSH
ncbi:MAG: electron transfer flavoprotein subunit alpha/FixB family protein [Saprospiraceae bacterium]|jgi:electron transfer flavoprotein alpha subunit|nr:electron transfer flavoprotein subunit alpha/FixB family protein [Saprospiraceae bacterium]HMT77242.1 electron transfer flavoprotein subunit alpha/FixB family protein [Saprospiraceae bacterium]HQU95956.1 electron transfer flavoprotein subunit alpha/FixB family protein [Saprospiraceae bacterium]HQW95490.1 electron transfer flavoprotein subunit alpha/FixB family protein [Saprospiraceae bacterium]